ncbi:aldehyde dehydrogenase family protein [Roseovarius gahaiensis]|uniref:Aldehyde dehydrogenase family protein n=1 Tax=Roseovarius gahaiensis TaxID=2716691 RepID=A0A967B8H9_9RHOB|nr:aldehyde dehydrogenase family protein [Roseovarius gahaiensis]NHQ73260.1 aldehyde dehydrogenase family protein [Roseovarius gahaiensis]
MTEHQSDPVLRYGPAPESAADALAWLVDQGDRFGQFIGGTFTPPGDGPDSRNPATGEVLATLTQARQSDVDAALAAAHKAQDAWADLGGMGRARHLRATARTVQDNARLLSVMEVLDSGQPLRRVRDVTLPLVQRQFEYHAGLAHAMPRMFPDRTAQGICALIIGDTAPLATLAARLAPALAAGNTVVVKPCDKTTLSALLLADLCHAAGLPSGVINIITGDARVGDMLAQHEGVDMVAFEGPTDAGRSIRQLTAGHGKTVTLELDDTPPILVFDDADLDSAIEGIVDGMTRDGGIGRARLLIQESAARQTLEALRIRITRLRVGNPLDANTDIGALTDPAWRDHLAALVQRAGGQVFAPDMDLPDTGAFYPPTLISGLSPADPAMQAAFPGPVVVSDTFRTQAEAVQMANATGCGRTAMIWTEDISRALTVAPQLMASLVTLNGTTVMDPKLPVDSLRDSGTGVIGGCAGLMAYTRRTGPRDHHPGRDAQDTPARIALPTSLDAAIKAAHGAVGWRRLDGTARAQALNQVAEALLQHQTDLTQHVSAQEVQASADQIFTFAALAETRHAPPAPSRTLTLHDPLGVIGMLYSKDAKPLLSLMTALGAVLASGNCTVVALSKRGPDLCKPVARVLGEAGLPAGAVALMHADLDDLATPIAGHMGIDAIWNLSSPDLTGRIEHASAGNFKRVFTAYGPCDAEHCIQDMLTAASRIKSVHLPDLP